MRKQNRTFHVLRKPDIFTCYEQVVAEATFGGVPTAIYDLFRIESGKIAEHWDTLQAIPPRDQWKNSNGKF